MAEPVFPAARVAAAVYARGQALAAAPGLAAAPEVLSGPAAEAISVAVPTAAQLMAMEAI